MMMAVSFQRRGRLYYLDPGQYTPSVGTKVLVPTDSGPEVAECIWAPQWVSEEIGGLPVCAGLATDEHLSRDEANRTKRAEGRVAARRLAREHGLPMKIIAVDYVDAGNVLTIYFSASHRVDFRALVRDLAARRDRPVRAGYLVLDIPEGFRAGIGADGQGPAAPGEPAADSRRLRAADVLPEVRASAVPGLPEERAEAGRQCRDA